MLATWPPGRINSAASSNVDAMPTASRDVRAEPVRELHDASPGVLGAVVDGDVRAELARTRQATVVEVDHDDLARRQQPGGQHRGQADRPRADDRDDVTRAHPAVEHAHLIRGREDVGEEQHLLVAGGLGQLVERGVGERRARVLGLQPVDRVPENPAPSAEALPVVGLLAEAASPAGADARHQHAVARCDRGHAGADLFDGADSLVPEDGTRGGLRDIALEDVQVGAADRRGVDPHDGVGRIQDGRIRDGVPGALAGTVIDEGLHDTPLGFRAAECHEEDMTLSQHRYARDSIRANPFSRSVVLRPEPIP
jgi:hypothetical protein